MRITMSNAREMYRASGRGGFRGWARSQFKHDTAELSPKLARIVRALLMQIYAHDTDAEAGE